MEPHENFVVELAEDTFLRVCAKAGLKSAHGLMEDGLLRRTHLEVGTLKTVLRHIRAWEELLDEVDKAVVAYMSAATAYSTARELLNYDSARLVRYTAARDRFNAETIPTYTRDLKAKLEALEAQHDKLHQEVWGSSCTNTTKQEDDKDGTI